jgi:hypothetical protein
MVKKGENGQKRSKIRRKGSEHPPQNKQKLSRVHISSDISLVGVIGYRILENAETPSVSQEMPVPGKCHEMARQMPPNATKMIENRRYLFIFSGEVGLKTQPNALAPD